MQDDVEDGDKQDVALPEVYALSTTTELNDPKRPIEARNVHKRAGKRPLPSPSVVYSGTSRIDLQLRQDLILHASTGHRRSNTESPSYGTTGKDAVSVPFPHTGETPGRDMYVREDKKGVLQAAYCK